MVRKLPLGVLVSGNGSNLQTIIDCCEEGTLDARIAVVLCNKSTAYALERCRKHNIDVAVIDHRVFPSRESFDRQAVEILKAAGVELVILAGFMRILSPEFFRAFPMRIMNIHPALLPAFPGIHAQQKALEYGVRFSGCTVHFADEGIDTGPIIIQAVVPVIDGDTQETLAQRILVQEHRIYPQAIQYYAEGKIEVSGRKVRIKDPPCSPDAVLYNPPLTRF